MRWSNRQFILGRNASIQINAGATRNIVITKCEPRVTEDYIRHDLELLNIKAIKVEFSDGNCHIKTNSVANSLLAMKLLKKKV